MRKYLKNNLLEIFQTIYAAHEIVKGFVDKKEYESAQNLLADCQDTAIQFGNLIEESEGEGFVTISFLEEYCEALYEAATNLSEESNGHKVQKQLDKKIMKAENSVKNDIKVKHEIVFMPYKRSMWDSLESVWKAADEAPDCDAYVVPIPYYDRKPDGMFGEFHYEGSEYPDYVPVVHYEAYNLEQCRPDVIYIHNPYDGNNYVTSVDPKFYSNELKKYTDMLVYIPYFVADESRLEEVTHFALTPGVVNADRVIVQSEAMRQVYINALLEYFGDTPGNRKTIEEKIMGIGSPKYDSVKSYTKDVVDIPDEWRKIIGNKKVVLYNTHLSLLMVTCYERFLPKLRAVLNYFKKRNDVVLLWRPHPLTISTAKSMNPAALEEYMEIVNEFCEGQWGIYDDSPDMERAIAISDAYYGSQSSMLSLYKLTGKPVLLHNINVPTEVL